MSFHPYTDRLVRSFFPVDGCWMRLSSNGKDGWVLEPGRMYDGLTSNPNLSCSNC
jgi:hypothetical protein